MLVPKCTKLVTLLSACHDTSLLAGSLQNCETAAAAKCFESGAGVPRKVYCGTTTSVCVCVWKRRRMGARTAAAKSAGMRGGGPTHGLQKRACFDCHRRPSFVDFLCLFDNCGSFWGKKVCGASDAATLWILGTT